MNYEERLGRPDFRVRYRWLPRVEGSFFQRPFQHIRCDFSYEGDDVSTTGIYMIWPEFEDESGRALPENADIAETGTASMWIVNRDVYAELHRSRIRVGVRGFFMVGGARIAEAEVVDVVDLAE